MALIEDQEVIITVDEQRSISLVPTDKSTLVLTVEDPHSVAVIEMKLDDAVPLYEALEDWIKR